MMAIYVLQVTTGREYYIKQMLEQSVLEDFPDAALRLFVPEKALNHKNNAEERQATGQKISRLQAILFPGYLFLESEHIDVFLKALHKFRSTKFVRLVGLEDDKVQEVTPHEMAHIRRLSGEDPSKGFIEGGKIRIVSGSLQGLESYVRKVDRRKGNILLEMEMFNRTVSVWVACDIAETLDENAGKPGS